MNFKKIISCILIVLIIFSNYNINILALNNEIISNNKEENQGIINLDDDNIIQTNNYYGKQTININEGWNFTKEGKIENINLPHSWEYTHPTMSHIPQMNKLTVTYEKTIDISKYKNKKIFLKFYGVNKKAVIYIDNKEVDTHIGGFSAFVVDITDYVNGDSANIKIEVTNLDTDTMPINTDFTHWAGIYRDVELIIAEDIYISMEDYASSGIYANSDVDVKNKSVKLDIKTAISYNALSKNEIIVKATLKDAKGNKIESSEVNYSVEGQEINKYINLPTMNVENIRLWNGTIDPYLYIVEVELIDKEGKLIDKEMQKIGFRTFNVTNEGFFLNDKPYKLKGVGFHQDREGYGNAVSKEMKKEDLEMIEEMGANAIRTAHYPHEQYIYDLADEMGLIVWNEIPFYLIMSKTEEFKLAAKQQLIEMIRQGYNHPSIVFWGIQNEVNTNQSYAQFGEQFNVSKEELNDFMRELAKLAKEEDSSRYIVQAHINGTAKAQESAMWTKDNPDIDFTGFNLYTGWYNDLKEGATTEGAEKIGTMLENSINKFRNIFGDDIPIIISEYGAGANINQHAEMGKDFIWKSEYTKGEFHPEEYQSFVHEANLKKITELDDIVASFAWSMFDFSCYRNEGGQERLNDKGLVTYDRKTKKDAFYLYKANWNKDEKFVYITSRRYTKREDNKTDIKVYSNMDSVNLIVNGVDYGKGNKQQEGVFVWKDIMLADSNKIVAVGTEYGSIETDEVNWVLDNNISLDKDSITLNKGKSDLLSVINIPEDESNNIIWSSSDENIAIVDEIGNVTAINVGSTLITAKLGNKVATCKVTVDNPLISISLNKENIEISKGESEVLNVILNPIDTTDESSIYWSSSDENIAIVDSCGKVNSINSGNTVITAKVGDKIATCKVTVKDVKQPSTGGSIIEGDASTKPTLVENKLIGNDRYETAIKISIDGWKNSDNVVIVNSSAIVDALSATPFAKIKNAPILLTELENLNNETKKEITRLGAKNVYVIGGKGVVSENVISQLKDMNLNVDRISGDTRYTTALEVAKRLGNVSEIAVVNGVTGLADAVSIAPVAADRNMPIVLASPNEGTKAFDEFIKSNSIKISYVIGGEAVISKDVASKLPNANRLGGLSRNETNAIILEKFYTNKKLNNIFVAKDGMKKSDDLIDALAVGVLASKQNSPVIIVDEKLDIKQEEFLKLKRFNNITQVGGNGNENAFNQIIKLLKQ
ncbi:cell wall-binding repeat-containing protein [Romboutsia timonensis]|uniref:cell wall-binding repeat-containing protein n=1 Tax=Romboutsia timonensis TaxID=1776391 RepID=UPI002A7FFC13|nr:cell wall-binding repeat-containing protein [Romboutsia timonensis]MDY3959847.1 cell wall-binding repeat-containing protein [Romboutsia timonensis]